MPVLPPAPPALQSPAPKPQARPAPKPAQPAFVPRPEAEDALFLAWDEGAPLPRPAVRGKDRAALAWLRANLAAGAPAASPFPAGSAEAAEARAWLAFLKAAPEVQAARLKELPLSLAGTQAGLWRWGQAATLAGRLAPVQRRLFEDRLAASPTPALRGLGLRHALCWALAEKDEARFAALREAYGFIEGELIAPFQRLFSLLGGPAPRFRMHALPGLQYRDLDLAELGGRRLWMMPAQAGLPDLPEGVAWIVPSMQGAQSYRETDLGPAAKAEAEAVATSLQAAGRRAWFAAGRDQFQAFGLQYFPILIELDAEGRIQAIRMGDAAPEKP
jgi:hypothetical protein